MTGVISVCVSPYEKTIVFEYEFLLGLLLPSVLKIILENPHNNSNIVHNQKYLRIQKIKICINIET